MPVSRFKLKATTIHHPSQHDSNNNSTTIAETRQLTKMIMHVLSMYVLMACVSVSLICNSSKQWTMNIKQMLLL